MAARIRPTCRFSRPAATPLTVTDESRFPLLRLFDHHREDLHRQLDPYPKLPNLHIDIGSDCSIDMTHTEAADIYLGEVSSQICEFLVRPRPCIFLSAAAIADFLQRPA